MIDLNLILKNLARKRPVFHSEADFQHALAWEIQIAYPDANIRLEKPFQFDKLDKKLSYIDLVIEHQGVLIGIELKYKTKKSEFDVNNELFSLKNHGDDDIGRYDFIKDISRLEWFVKNHDNAIGYAIFLTNDFSYKKEKLGTIDAEFSLHELRNLTGIMQWSQKASSGTIKNREKPLHLSFQYQLNWQEYSALSDYSINDVNFKADKFEFLSLEVFHKFNQ